MVPASLSTSYLKTTYSSHKKMKKVQSITMASSLLFAVIGFFAYTARNDYFSVIPMLLLAVPAYLALLKTNLWKGLLFIAILSIYATSIEALSIKTSFPYGAFEYNAQLGYKLFDLVPWTVSFGWVPLVIGCFALSSWIFNKRSHQFFAGVLLLVVSDLILDPSAVLMNFWTWSNPGIYYSIPFSNYLGWILSSIIGGLVLFGTVPKNDMQQLPFYSTYTLALGNAFWIGVTLNASFWIPFFVGIILQVVILLFVKTDLNSTKIPKK
jgi:putative membrane protein